MGEVEVAVESGVPRELLVLLGAELEPVRELRGGGLVNRTYLLGEPPRLVLQRVNPVFPAEVDRRIQAVTRHLAARGLETPRLVPVGGQPDWLGGGGERWRVLTYVPGRSYHRLPSAGHALRGAGLVGRFHAALADYPGSLEPLRPGVHDTDRHLAALEAALGEARGPLAGEIRAVGEELLSLWARWRGELLRPGLPPRPAHGDLKFSNLRFAPDGETPRCLLDLDTLGRLPLDAELGDLLRSWANAAGEDAPEARLDPALAEAALRGYLRAAPGLSPEERESLLPGAARISLELAARFCADAVHDRYFGWDPAVAPSRPAHDLLRARNQLSLARQFLEAWPALARLLRP